MARKYRNRRSGKRRYRRKSTSMVVKGTSPIPDNLFTRIQYNYVTPGAPGLPRGYVKVKNSLFDPDGGGTITIGNQSCNGLADFDNLYKRNRIFAIKALFRITNENDEPIVAIMYPTAESAITNDMHDSLGVPRAKSVQIAQRETKTVSGYFTSESVLGFNPKNDDACQATWTTDPAKLWFVYLDVNSVDALTNVQCSITAHIVYYVRMEDRITLAQI